jgi:hypothetical protein
LVITARTGCGETSTVPAGSSVLLPIPFTRQYVLLWPGCHDLVLRFRDGGDLTLSFDLR